MPKISVIIPVYGVENYIERCAKSLFEQTLDDIEYIFIDDCSPDKSLDVLMNVIDLYPHLKSNIVIIRNSQNLGPSATRNKGFEVCSGDYVICCDSDDFLEKNAYELMYTEAVKEQAEIVSCGMCGGGSVYEGVALFNSLESIARESLYDITKIEGVLYSSACNKLVKRELLKKHSLGFHEDVKMWDDLFLVFRMRYYAQKTAIVNLPLYHYVERENSIIKTNFIEKSRSQIKCAELIESFIKEHNEYSSFERVIEFLKFRARDILFQDEYIETWIKEIKNSRVIFFIPFYGIMRTMLYCFVKFGGIKAWNLLKTYRKIKNSIL